MQLIEMLKMFIALRSCTKCVYLLEFILEIINKTNLAHQLYIRVSGKKHSL